MLQRRLRLYLAAPLFSDGERAYNEALSASLQAVADIFLPQRDGLLLTDLIRSGVAVPLARRMIFDVDIAAIKECDVMLAILDGRAVDEGVAFELGVAHTLSKFCIGLRTDGRSLLPSGDNPMIALACGVLCRSEQEIYMALRSLARSKRMPFASDNLIG